GSDPPGGLLPRRASRARRAQLRHRPDDPGHPRVQRHAPRVARDPVDRLRPRPGADRGRRPGFQVLAQQERPQGWDIRRRRTGLAADRPRGDRAAHLTPSRGALTFCGMIGAGTFRYEPPRLRVTEEASAERHATWFELYFDLVFAAAVIELVTGL